MRGGERVLGALAAVGLSLAAMWYYRRRQREVMDPSIEEDTARILTLPIIDFRLFDSRNSAKEAYMVECRKVAEALHKYGLCVVRDPRVDESHNSQFIDMMERYFEMSDGIRDARPEYAFQVGVTPEFTGMSLYLVLLSFVLHTLTSLNRRTST